MGKLGLDDHQSLNDHQSLGESGRASKDLGRSRRVLNSPRGSRGVQKGLGSLKGPGGSEQDYRHEDQGEMEGLLGSGRAHEGQQGRRGSGRVQKGSGEFEGNSGCESLKGSW